eukprot:8728739-Alexandrium_andersonii.AAC.1
MLSQTSALAPCPRTRPPRLVQAWFSRWPLVDGTLPTARRGLAVRQLRGEVWQRLVLGFERLRSFFLQPMGP